MKFFGLVLGLVLFGSVSQAHVYRCTVDGDESAQYLLVVHGVQDSVGKTSIFKFVDYGYQAEFLEAKFEMFDGDSVTVITGQDTSKTDWTKENACYRFKKPSLTFRLENGLGGARTGTLQKRPSIDISPKGCAKIPNLALPPQQSVSCQNLLLDPHEL